jgi:hypothetical protein
VTNRQHVLKKRLGQQATGDRQYGTYRPWARMGAGSRTLARGRRPKRGGRLLQLPPLIGSLIPAHNGPSYIRVTTATGRCRASCGLATRTSSIGDRQYGTYRPRALNGRGVPRPGKGTAPETGRSPIRLTVRTTPTPGPPESMLPFSTLTPARGRRVPHYSQVRPAAGPLGTRPNTVLSLLGPGGGLSRTWPAGPRPRRPRQARQSISQSLPES